MIGAAAFPHHEEASVVLRAPLETCFAWLDDFHLLGSHMEQRSGMMAGSRMTIETDERGGRAVGSEVRMVGRILGMALSLREVVTEREPPLRKAWQTVEARLVVIGQYRLGFDLAPEGGNTRARIFIDYALPERARWLGTLFGRRYALWCVGRMAADAARHFNPSYER